MVKRSSQVMDGAAAFRKRQKLSQEAPTSEDVTSAEHLLSLLTFNQNMRNARHGLQSFKHFLDGVIANNDDKGAKLAILKQYLESVKPRDTSEDAVHFHDIMEMWSFAIQVGDEGVMSAVAVVLALLLQVISESWQLVPYGNGLCQTLLQDAQLRSVARNLSSEKAKGFIISPTLRLLREAVCLDGGVWAKKIVRARAYTFASLGRNLEIDQVAEDEKNSRKTSVRSHATRFLLSCLKYLHSEGRKELASQKDLLSHLTYMIKNDPPSLVLEILDSLKSHVLMDAKISREVKFRAFSTKVLMRLLSLYTYAHPLASTDERELVSETAHKFLTFACTTPGAGILYPYRGLYPKQADEILPASSARHRRGAKSGGDPWEGKFRDGVPVFNFALSDFASKLRPWSSLKHCELLVAILAAAPELISDYFSKNLSFTFEPKLSMTWIGYATFLFETMMIPIPPSFGDAARYAVLPPPTWILLDNIIPRPITRKVLVRCLSSQSNLTAFFATRILVAALEKFSAAVRLLDDQANGKNLLWADASRKVMDMFCQCIPDMKDIVRCYKGVPAENVLQRTLTSRLLRLYYEVIPRVALAANFDVSPFLIDALQQTRQNDAAERERRNLSAMELGNLVSIASYSPGMRWFARLEPLGGDRQKATSPFTALLKLLCRGAGDQPLDELKAVLGEVAAESQIVTDPAALKPLLQTLSAAQNTVGSGKMASVWSLLDNCVSRCATSPIKYLDKMKEYSPEFASPAAPCGFSLLSVVILEQLPYALGAAADNQAIQHLAAFTSLYFNAVAMYSGNTDTASLSALHREAEKQFSGASAPLGGLGDKKLVKLLKKHDVAWARGEAAAAVADGQHRTKRVVEQGALRDLLHTPFPSAEDAAALTKWASRSAEDMVEEGWAAGLVRLLTSEHTNLRKEALTGIRKMAAAVKESQYEEKTQVWLLLSEVAESCGAQVDAGPVPSALTAFAVHALEILKTPLHPLYSKVNSYLTRSPVWGLDKLPLAHDILHGAPSEDDKYYTELTWLLSYLLDSLATPRDLDVFHSKRWFEKILALGSNPYLRSALRTRLLRLVYRATCIPAGSTTLITRFGILSWLASQRSGCDGDDEAAALYDALAVRAWETCDQERVAAWSKGGARRLLEAVS
ncbi:uncharacterized protein UV8b_00938 [Ustilaginoidea virens]|uniref:Ribosome biogenesis protein Urb1 n=1 Tax=Ustilaginoidea virens TaxID=1159556 RepID=A0A8E5MEJ7_USTVR|nr:uncharacterized protein UV8b_00938 [Ustilaginoidea virens]QUC16697.1 hypothetical protein UV8b_00938 [Ustilaginoidea virens]